jgi:hypothetical protein
MVELASQEARQTAVMAVVVFKKFSEYLFAVESAVRVAFPSVDSIRRRAK